MPRKNFKIRPEELRELVPAKWGGCVASDRITVHGMKVGFMYREKPDLGPGAQDSGWRFFAGDESEDYTSNPDNFSIYRVNTIANYDPDIVSLLDSPIGSAFGRKSKDAPLTPEQFDPPE